MLIEFNGQLERSADEFQSALPHTREPYNSRAWGHSLHSLCSYQGKLKPSLAHWAVRHFTTINDRVLDPLGGVGTIAFEAGLLGRAAFTCDLSPLASTVARAKVAPPNKLELKENLEAFINELSAIRLDDSDYRAAEFGLNAKVQDYFHPQTLEEVLKARRLLSRSNLAAPRNFIKACLLHILHGNRPYALSRTSHPITPFRPSGAFEYRSVAEKLRTRCERLMNLEWPDEFVPGLSWHSDFRAIPKLITAPVNAIICSPPFPGMRFDRPNWLRMWFCGWMEADFHNTSRGFLERQQGTNFKVYEEFFAVCNQVTTTGSPVVLHVGGSKAYDMAEKLITIGSRYLRHLSTITENVEQLERHGIVDKGLTKSHMLLLFQRV